MLAESETVAMRVNSGILTSSTAPAISPPTM